MTPSSLVFNATQGAANPASQAVTISNGGAGALTGLSTGPIVYGAGASNWLTVPSLSATTAPATLSLQPQLGALSAGTYTATVPVQAVGATNSPQTLTITLIVAPVATGSLTVTITGLPTGANGNVTVTGPNAYSRTVTATSTLSGLTPGSYTVSASGVTANGSYAPSPATQSVIVSANATTSATVTYAFVAAPAIAMTPSSLVFNATQGATNPASQAVTISNGGTGALTGLSTGTIVYGVGASNWLTVPSLSATTAPATLSLQPQLGALSAGTYTATVPVQAVGATNSPQTLTITLIVAPVATGGLTVTITGLPTGANGNVTVTGPNAYSRTVTATSTLSGLTPGTYTVSASGVTANGSYAPSPATRSVIVSANATTSATVTYAFVAAPAIAMAPSSLVFNATQGATNPASQAVTISNGGTGALTGLSTGTIAYGAGASNWLTVPSLSATTAPATLSLQPQVGALSAGTYTATVPVQAVGATNSPQTLTITLIVAPVATGSLTVTITGLPTGANGNVTVTGPNAYSRAVTATSTLSGLTPGTYTVSAVPVSAGGSYIALQAIQQVSVAAGVSSGIVVSYVGVPGGIRRIEKAVNSKPAPRSAKSARHKEKSGKSAGSSDHFGGLCRIMICTHDHADSLRLKRWTI